MYKKTFIVYCLLGDEYHNTYQFLLEKVENAPTNQYSV